MFICFNDGIGRSGMGDTLQEAWEDAQNNGVDTHELEDCVFYEVSEPIEVEQKIVPVTKVVAQTTNQPKRK